MVVDQNFLKVKRYYYFNIFIYFFYNFFIAENLNFKKIVNLNDPWGSTFINNNELLITEKSGKIKLLILIHKKFLN